MIHNLTGKKLDLIDYRAKLEDERITDQLEVGRRKELRVN